jgi:hypothetical protein
MAHQSEPRLLVLHGLRLKGFAEADVVAAVTGVPGDAVSTQLEAFAADGLVLRRDGRVSGWSLTPTGRKEHERLLADELDSAGVRHAVEDAYRRFVALNGDMLAICTAWQLQGGEGGPINDHTDKAYDDAVIARLVGLHDGVRPITADLRDQLTRFEPYGGRLRTALERLVGGDTDYFTKPMIDSYHTVWFELHEDLLATLGIERASEEGS